MPSLERGASAYLQHFRSRECYGAASSARVPAHAFSKGAHQPRSRAAGETQLNPPSSRSRSLKRPARLRDPIRWRYRQPAPRRTPHGHEEVAAAIADHQATLRMQSCSGCYSWSAALSARRQPRESQPCCCAATRRSRTRVAQGRAAACTPDTRCRAAAAHPSQGDRTTPPRTAAWSDYDFVWVESVRKVRGRMSVG